ncbi:hypothetical protein GIB67_016255 [Kingdonia uniflora]|uniref:Uncharacterized protein n=1 Tax=Kingdonia uniflora TaxID=39325 RepID=A0A7J7LT21_9MAGN|nr:hypothetical protein GIB67_016255 [Kingdonia uniflora]
MGTTTIEQSSSSSPPPNKRRWSNLIPFFVALIVIAEIAFLYRLDIAKNASLVHNWTDSLYFNCEEWLEKQDSLPYYRDFQTEPIWVSGLDEEFNSCAIGCKFGHNPGLDKSPDAAFGLHQNEATASVIRSMESATYYAENDIARARRWIWPGSRLTTGGDFGSGYAVVMTTSLSSDVPVGYFSWAEYDIMAPPQPKTESALAAAFISNCAARNFRLQALEKLEKSNIKIDSYGGCHRNRDGRGQHRNMFILFPS